MTLAIEATGLARTFGQTRAVDGVDLAARRCCIYGVLGPNGAIGTTTIRMLATLIRPNGGSATVLVVSLTGQLASVDLAACPAGAGHTAAARSTRSFAASRTSLLLPSRVRHTDVRVGASLRRRLGRSGRASRVRRSFCRRGG